MRSHFNASIFAEEIDRIDLYFISDPFEREIYETFAITKFNGVYNRAKKYKNRKSPTHIKEYIEDINYEIRLLKLELETILQDKLHYEISKKPPRKYNNFTGGLTEAYCLYLDMQNDNYAEVDEEDADSESEYRYWGSRIREIEVEIRELGEKRHLLLQKLVI